jgi:hypothetical protein
MFQVVEKGNGRSLNVVFRIISTTCASYHESSITFEDIVTGLLSVGLLEGLIHKLAFMVLEGFVEPICTVSELKLTPFKTKVGSNIDLEIPSQYKSNNSIPSKFQFFF